MSAGGTRGRPRPVDIAFLVAYGLIGIAQVTALILATPWLTGAAEASRYALLAVALLQIGTVVARTRRDSEHLEP